MSDVSKDISLHLRPRVPLAMISVLGIVFTDNNTIASTLLSTPSDGQSTGLTTING